MGSEDVGKNLTGVQALIRKHDILVKDMSAIADRKKELEGESVSQGFICKTSCPE